MILFLWPLCPQPAWWIWEAMSHWIAVPPSVLANQVSGIPSLCDVWGIQISNGLKMTFGIFAFECSLDTSRGPVWPHYMSDFCIIPDKTEMLHISFTPSVLENQEDIWTKPHLFGITWMFKMSEVVLKKNNRASTHQEQPRKGFHEGSGYPPSP